MDIRAKPVHEAPTQADELRLLVHRQWPHGLAKKAGRVDRHLKELAASGPLFCWFRHYLAHFERLGSPYLEGARPRRAGRLDGLVERRTRER